MSIIKVNIEGQGRYIVELIPEIIHTVKDFLNMVNQVCQLNVTPSQMVLKEEEYVLPHLLSSRAIKSDLIYNVAIESKKNPKKWSSTSKKLDTKILNHKFSQKSSSISSDNSYSQMSSDSQQGLHPKNVHIRPKTNTKSVSQHLGQNISKKQQKQQKLKKVTQAKAITKNHKVPQLSQNSSSNSSQSSSSQSNFPQLHKNKSQPIQKIKTTPNTKLPQKKQPVNEGIKKILPSKNQPLKRTLINASPSSSSSESSEIVPTKKQKMDIKQPIRPKQSSKQIPNKKVESAPLTPKKLPVNLRNRGALQQHKQHQWFSVSRQMVGSIKDWEQAALVQPNNNIRFRIIELDEEKFIPRHSDWIYAEVVEISSSGDMKLRQVRFPNNKYEDSYQIKILNMAELQINQQHMTQTQQDLLKANQPQSKVDSKPEVQVQKPIESSVPAENNDQGKQSVEKFVCGQVNYYFGQKNWDTDLFLQMHANRNPQQKIPLRVILNCQKIKKVVRSEDKLLEYLEGDEKQPSRNYQLFATERMVKRKVKTNPKKQEKPVPIKEEPVDKDKPEEEKLVDEQDGGDKK